MSDQQTDITASGQEADVATAAGQEADEAAIIQPADEAAPNIQSTTAKPNMQTVVAVRLRYNPKAFWFDPVLSTYQTGDHVLVDTERGREVGLVVDGALEVPAKEIKELKTPLKPVIRALSEIDFEIIDELDAKGREAMPIFRELIAKHQLDMKPVSVEYLFSGDKAVFYFSNDERVDFRDLVRDLASHFHTRIDMRQIGVRDEARILGGLAHCGEELCCARLGGEFQPVSIRIAKEQDLPLNPAKISGACGRLMCCLRYEFEAYKDFKGRAPKKGALIETPLGQAKVIDYDTPREIIQMRLEDGKQLSIPLREFDCRTDDNGRSTPCSVSKDAINRCASSSILMVMANLEQELVQSAAPAKAPKAEHEQEVFVSGVEREQQGRRPRRSNRQKAEGGSAERGPSERGSAERGGSADRGQAERRSGAGRPQKDRQGRRERRDGASRKNTEKTDAVGTPRRRNASGETTKQRPGQNSSGLRNPVRSHGQKPEQTGRPGEAADRGAEKAADKRPGTPRRRWRRSGGSGSGGSGPGGPGPGSGGSGSGSSPGSSSSL